MIEQGSLTRHGLGPNKPATGVAPPIAGPVLGGHLTEHLDRRRIFSTNLPMGAVALAVAATVLLRLPRPGSGSR
ncbi:hypothetical protein [Nonomuraea sp. bgisy101]|uniref:hypothetical protein n=1 Tax=Nonomuraea sp. bgisy101 TaxID=3413784 RepID=UPI003D75D8AC